jgi:hypothetical protein
MKVDAEMPVAIVEVSTDHDQSLLLSASDREEIRASLDGQCEVVWLPESAPDERGTAHRAHLEFQTLIYVVGTVVLGVTLKEFFKSLASEAGKSAWAALRRLTSRILSRKLEAAYRTVARVILIRELEGAYVGIWMTFEGEQQDLSKPEELESRLDREIAEYLHDIARNETKVSAKLQKELRESRTFEANLSRHVFVVQGASDDWVVFREDFSKHRLTRFDP